VVLHLMDELPAGIPFKLYNYPLIQLTLLIPGAVTKHSV